MERMYSLDQVVTRLEFCLIKVKNCESCRFKNNLNCIGQMQQEILKEIKEKNGK